MKAQGVIAVAATICCVMTACSAGPEPDPAAGPSPLPATGPPAATGSTGSTDDRGSTASASPSRGPGTTAPTGTATASERFGRTATYGNGVAVRIDAPAPFTPSPWVERRKGTAMRLAVTVHNRSNDEFNPSQLNVTLRSPYGAAVQIFDHENGVMARPEHRLKPGRSVTFAVGYWVTDPDMVVEFDPGFEYGIIVVRH